MYGGENMWWLLIDGSVMFYDGFDELDSFLYFFLFYVCFLFKKDL